MMHVAVIGCGYWGPKLVRNFLKARGCQVVAVADTDPCRLEAMRRLYPFLATTTSAESLLASSDVDAVAIATPVATHFELARNALHRGKHVLLEKPLAASSEQARMLVHLAEEQRRVLMVDHIFVYTGAVRKIREIITSGELGEIYYYDAVRVNLGLFQHDVNVLWDLAPHDFAIVDYLIGKEPARISAVGATPVRMDGWDFESIVYVAVEFTDGTLAHFHVNWLSPVKIRRTLIGGSRKIIVYDDLDPENQIKVFDKGVEIRTDQDRRRALMEYRTGDMLAPKVDQTEALEVMCQHFVDCIRDGRRPITDGYAGLRVVELLEAAQRSLLEQKAGSLAV